MHRGSAHQDSPVLFTRGVPTLEQMGYYICCDPILQKFPQASDVSSHGYVIWRSPQIWSSFWIVLAWLLVMSKSNGGDLSLLRDVSRDSRGAPMVLFSMEFYLEIEGWRRGLRSRGLSGLWPLWVVVFVFWRKYF